MPAIYCRRCQTVVHLNQDARTCANCYRTIVAVPRQSRRNPKPPKAR